MDYAVKETRTVIDVLYIVATLLFFGLMSAYVAACDRLGQKTEVDEGVKEQQ